MFWDHLLCQAKKFLLPWWTLSSFSALHILFGIIWIIHQVRTNYSSSVKCTFFSFFIKIALHFVIGISRSTYAKGLKWGVGFILLSWILTLVFVLGLAFVITLLNRPLSWFARPIWIFFLYIIPTFLTSIFVAQAFKRKFNTVSFTRTVFHCVKKEIYYSCCVSDDLITVDNIDDLLRQQYLHIHNDFFVPDALVHTI